VGEPDDRFRELVALRWPALVRTAFLLTGERAAAEDLVQTALTKTYVAWRRLRDPEAAEAYVRRTMVTTYTSWWRRYGRERVMAEVPSPGGGTGGGTGGGAGGGAGEPDRELEAVLSRSVLWPLLAELPRGQRAVVVLRFYEDLTEVETARHLGCSVGTVKSQSSRALSRLRQRMAEQADPGPTDPEPAEREAIDRAPAASKEVR